MDKYLIRIELFINNKFVGVLEVDFASVQSNSNVD